jgi:uncharacterized membrane protein YeaQ/YmgE (transglycosylase-associated protein family)
MSILAWIVVGVIAGFLAKTVIPGEGGGGIIGDLIIGIVGAVVGGWIMTAIGYGGANGINLWSIVVAFMGAAALLWAGRAFMTNRPLN